jgi:hypothetical protein
MMGKNRSRVGLWAAMLAAACGSDVTAPVLAGCNSAVQPLVLNVGAYTAIDPGLSAGCVVFPANASTTDSAEYLIVPQVAGETPDNRSSFKLVGGQPGLAPPPVAALPEAAPASPAQRFHDRLRLMEQNGAFPAPVGPPWPAGRAGLAAAAAAAPGDTLGNVRTFKVPSSVSNPILYQFVGAIARSVGQHIVLYVDNAAPMNFSTADYDNVRSDLDTLLYAVDTTAFGRESDIDGNGRVIVLMTNIVNKLVTEQECKSTGYVSGFFLGSDLAPSTRAQWNSGEIFYSIVADPDSTLSCKHSNTQVKAIVPVTFVHEFQHMISYNQHALLRVGSGEELWLNEGMSHYAEERGGRAFLAATPADSTLFCHHVVGNLGSLSRYWADPGSHALVGGAGGLEERGADWLFVRYLVDRFAQDTSLAAADAWTRQLVRTSATGTGNVAAVTGQAFAKLAEEWALASWVSDLPGFTAPAALRHKHWAFRTAYPRMRLTCSFGLPDFPLVARAGAGPSINVTGTMWSGSGAAYQRALQGPSGAGFTLVFSDATGAQLNPAIQPRLNVLRIR